MTFASSVMDSDDQTALEFLKQHWDEIAYVHLQFYWARAYIAEISNCYVRYHGRCYPSVAAFFYADSLDAEYSFSGTKEDAVKFFENYGVWDGRLSEKDIDYGVLFKEFVEDSYALEEPVELYSDDGEYHNISCQGLHFYDGKDWRALGSYKGAEPFYE